jgi:sigma-B regulation protein RsbU (phosphoserine phosphatase)
MLMVQSVARALEEQGESDPKLFLSVLNRVIYKNIVRTESDKHLTLAFIDIDGHGRAVLSGQHEQVIVVRSNGSIELIDTNDLGFPVGLEPDISQFVSTRTLQLGQGDVLVLHTDGVTEAEDPMGGFYGIGRLCESAGRHAGGSADSIKNGIIGDLMVHIASQKIHDDITLVVAKQR